MFFCCFYCAFIALILSFAVLPYGKNYSLGLDEVSNEHLFLSP